MGEAQIVLATRRPHLEHRVFGRDFPDRPAGGAVHISRGVCVRVQPFGGRWPPPRWGPEARSVLDSFHPHVLRVVPLARLPH